MVPRRGNIVIIGNSPFRAASCATLADRLLKVLPAAGYELRVIYPIYKGTPQWRPDFAERYPNIEVYWYDMPDIQDVFGGITADYLAFQARAIQTGLHQFIDDQRPDLVYLHKESSMWGMPPFLLEQGLPFLATLHGNLVSMLNCVTDDAMLPAWLSDFRRADRVICCADHMAARLSQAGLTNTVTVHNGVDVAQFRRRSRPAALAEALGIADDEIVLLHASDLIAVKRPLDIVRGFADALRTQSNLRLVLVGVSYAQQVGDSVAAEARRLGVSDRVQFCGWIEPRHMPQYYALADITLQASASEGLSLALLESMASGCALIASDIPASRELIRDGVDGLLFPVGDVAGLSKAVQVLASDSETRSRLGASARERVVAEFSQSSMEKEILRVIDQLLSTVARARDSLLVPGHVS